MRRPSGRLAVSLVLFLLGFLVVVQLHSQATDQGLNALSVQDLTELVASVTARNNELRAEIQALEQQRDQVAAAVERGDTSAVQIRADLDRIRGWAGIAGVKGAGVRVTVAGPVPAEVVEELLNELHNAGAEAMSIGSIRVVTGVVATGPAGSVTVSGILLADPLVLQAVGEPQTLAGSLTRAGGPIAQLATRFPDVVITVTAEDLVTIPATDRDLRPVLGRPRL